VSEQPNPGAGHPTGPEQPGEGHGIDAWRELASKDLKGDDPDERLTWQTPEGIAVKPLYTAESDEAAEAVTVVASDIRNDVDPIFTYYSGDYPADTEPLTPAKVTEVKYIQFRLIIDVDPNQDPSPIDIVSQVQLRSLKTNLGQEVDP
jgi:hypothetical protein